MRSRYAWRIATEMSATDKAPITARDARMIFAIVKRATELVSLLKQARTLAKRYRELTGRPLGITGEIAEAEAVRLLKVELAPVRTAGYDVIRRTRTGIERLQVKGRVVYSKSMAGQRIGTLSVKKKWDGVLLVLMDGNFDTIKIFEAARRPLVKAIKRPGSTARNERGALSVTLFCRIGHQVWPQK
jgi:hypothetical protein